MKKLTFNACAAICVCFLLGFTEWNSEAPYREHSLAHYAQIEEMLHRLNLKGNEKILDVGCGDGRVTAALARKVMRGGLVIGIDPSPSMLEKAELTCAQEIELNLSFQAGRAETFSFPFRFNVIVSTFALNWVKDQFQALKNISSHLEDSGKIYFILATPNEGLPLEKALKRTLAEWPSYFSDYISPQCFFDPETYRQMLNKTGFHIEDMHYSFRRSQYPDSAIFSRWVEQWLPHVKILPSSEKKRFMHTLIKYYLEESGQIHTSSPIFYGEYILTVEAMKIGNWF